MKRYILAALVFSGCASITPQNLSKSTHKQEQSLSHYDKYFLKNDNKNHKNINIADKKEKIADKKEKKETLPSFMNKKITLNTKNMPYDKFVQMLGLMSGTTIILDRKIKRPLNIMVKNATLKEIFDKITLPYGFDYTLRNGIVYIKTYEMKILKLYIPASIRKASTSLASSSSSGTDNTQSTSSSLSVSNFLDVDIWTEVSNTITQIIADEEKTSVNITYTYNDKKQIANQSENSIEKNNEMEHTNTKAKLDSEEKKQNNNEQATDSVQQNIGIPVNVKGIDLKKVAPTKDINKNVQKNNTFGNVNAHKTEYSTNRNLKTKDKNVLGENNSKENSVDFSETLSLSYNYKPFVQINKLSGLVIVKARPQTVKKIEEYVKTLNKILNREILIQLEIVEFQNSTSVESGVNWNKLIDNIKMFGNGGMLKISQNFGTQSTNGVNIIFNNGSFNTVINALKQQGNVKVISTPRITTLNNQPAIIKVGNDRMIVYTQATYQNTSDDGAITTSSEITINKTPIVSEGLTLYVLPRYNEYKKETILNIVPIIQKLDGTSSSDLDTQLSNMVIADPRNFQTKPIPINIATKQLNAIAKLKDDQLLILGGLSYTNNNVSERKIPLLGDIPLLGSVFKYKKKGNEKSYLLFLIKVRTN